MQLEDTVSQEFLDTYVGGGIVIENDRTLTKGTVVRAVLKGSAIDVTLKDTSWRLGELEAVDGGKWSGINPHTTSVLLSSNIKSLQNGVLVLHPSPRETSAQLTPLGS